MIEIQEFHKAYDRTIAVRGLTLKVNAGEIWGLIGPNGAGKTTTLRALSGLIPPSRGQLRVAGFDVLQQPLQAKQRLAYIPDEPQLFSDLTVAQHLAFTAAVYRVTNADQKAASLLDDFELADRQTTPARDLSRGMKQKLAVCCAYLHDPQVILFDEPLTGLDPRGIRRLKQSIVDRAATGSAIIVSSHLLAMVEDICSHVLILHRGQVRSQGPLTELRSSLSVNELPASLEDVFFQNTDDTSALPLLQPTDVA